MKYMGKEENTMNISPETLKEMKKFFIQTSIPRLIEKKREESQNEHNHSRTNAAVNG